MLLRHGGNTKDGNQSKKSRELGDASGQKSI
jgi:hypothetical protein